VLVVVVVAVSPAIEGEVDVDADGLAHQLVHCDRREEREVGHVVELDEQAHHVERMDRPPHQSQVVLDQQIGQHLDQHRYPDRSPRLEVVRFDIVIDKAGHLLRIYRFGHTNIFMINKPTGVN